MFDVNIDDLLAKVQALSEQDARTARNAASTARTAAYTSRSARQLGQARGMRSTAVIK